MKKVQLKQSRTEKNQAFLGKTKDNPYLSLLSLFGSRAEKDGQYGFLFLA
jgi:hypothetical protein